MTPPDAEGAAPLTGRAVVVTRAREQASRLVTELRAVGATVVEVPVIAIAAAGDGGDALRTAVGDAARYEWIVVTSANGVDAVIGAADGRVDLRGVRFAVVGPATADALRARGLDAALVPERFVAEGLLEAFPAPAGSGRILVAQADAARPTLADGLRALGWDVDVVEAYRTVPAVVGDTPRAAVVAADAITFTSASTVSNFVAALGIEAVPSVVVSIGPITTAAARGVGIEVTAEADPHTIEGVVAALVSHYSIPA